MESLMCGFRSKGYKVFGIIVSFVSIKMMNLFFRQKESSDKFFNYKSMLLDSIVAIPKRMGVIINKNISLFYNSALPIYIFFFSPLFFKNYNSFLRMFFTIKTIVFPHLRIANFFL